MKKLLLLALAAIIMTGCNGRFGKKTNKVVNDGHDYQWIIVGNIAQYIHSPECDTCRIIRHEEIKLYVDSVLNKK